MHRIPELTSAIAELHRLKQVRNSLSDSLSSHAARLKSTGALPPEDLLDELLNYRTGLFKLSADLIPAEPGNPAAHAIHPPLTLVTAQDVVDAHFTVRGCRETLQHIQRLSHVEDGHFAPLAQCREMAAQALQKLNDTSVASLDAATLQAEQRPFKGLLSLVEADSELSDAEWTANQELVGQTWGRNLSTAVARGKIRLLPDSIPESEPVHDVEPKVEPDTPAFDFAEPLCTLPTVQLRNKPVIPVERDEIVPTTQASPVDAIEQDAGPSDDQDDLVFDTVGEGCTERSPSRSYRANDLKRLADEPFQWARSQPPTTSKTQAAVPRDNAVALLARTALEADFSNRAACLSPLIVQLLWEDHPVLAHCLAVGQQGRPADRAYVPPPWLVHALTLGRHMCYSRGEIARQIELDLGQFTPELLATRDVERDAANGFLVRAAALLPALLTASPAAARIFKSFRISPGLSYLYNYCSRIVRYGQQLQGQAADLFTPDCDLHLWTAELEDLQQSIAEWLPRTMNRFCPATKTSPLFLHAHWTLMASSADRHSSAARQWSKWQEVFHLVHKLLAPIHTADESGRQSMKSEVERLTQAVRLESASHQADGSQPMGVLLFPDEQMVVVIREALAFANRWLRLCAAKPDQGKTLMNREAEILRDEILERTDGVVTELAAYSQTHPSTAIKASIACLCRTIEHLRMIFSPHTTLALREPAPQEIMMSELALVPHLEFDAGGHPLLSSDQLVESVLNYLQDATLDLPQTAIRQSTPRGPRTNTRILVSTKLMNARDTKPTGPTRDTEASDTCWE